MNKCRLTVCLGGSLVMLALLAGQTAMAQSAIMNVPSTDVVHAGGTYLEFDFITNYAWEREHGFQNYIPRVVVGLGKNVEAGINVSYTRVRGEQESLEVQPNVKWQFYTNEGKGIAASIGCILYLPVIHRAGTNNFGFCYSALSKKFAGNYGPRFSGGTYLLVHSKDREGTKAGALVGYEQPLARKVSFIVDWASGNNRFGFVSPALTFSTSSKSALSTGYSIANHGRGNNALFAYYGITF
jgi:hypothetical protein